MQYTSCMQTFGFVFYNIVMSISHTTSFYTQTLLFYVFDLNAQLYFIQCASEWCGVNYVTYKLLF